MYKDIPLFLQDFLKYLKTIKGLSDNTVKEYYYDLRLYLKYISYRLNPFDYSEDDIEEIDIRKMNVKTLDKIGLIDIHSYISYRDNDLLNSSTTRARKISSLKTFYKYLNGTVKLIDTDPTINLESPKIKKRNPVYLTLDESTRLLETIGENKNEFFRKRDFAIVLTFLTTGLRLSELSSMDLDSIKNGQFNVIGKGNKERVVYMTEACEYAIRDYIKIRPKVDKEDALFLSSRHQRMSNRAIQHMIDKYIVQAGFDPKLYSTHKLRHTAATLMYKEGVDIRTLQKILGHNSVATTQIYTHVDDQEMKKAISANPLSKINIDIDKKRDD